MSVDAIAKLAHYTISLLADPLLATWRARREVEANRIRARGQADIMELLAVGEAEAELSARAVRELAEGSQSLATLIDDEIEQRIESLFEKRLSNLAQIVGKARYCLPADEVPDSEPDMAWTSSFSALRKTFPQTICKSYGRGYWLARLRGREAPQSGRSTSYTILTRAQLDSSGACALWPCPSHYRKIIALTTALCLLAGTLRKTRCATLVSDMPSSMV